MAKLFFYDTETTGLSSYKNAIHQIAGAIVIDGELKERFNFHLAPHFDAVIDDRALAVSNVTIAQVKDYPPAEDTYKALTKMLAKYVDKFNKTDKFFLVGFNNASFDDDFFRSFFMKQGDKYFGSWFWADPIDLRVLAANHLMAERHKMENFQQRTVAKKLGIEVDETKLHDADYDIDLTMQIFDIVGNVDAKKNEPSVEEKFQEIARFQTEVTQANEEAKLPEVHPVSPSDDQEKRAHAMLNVVKELHEQDKADAEEPVTEETLRKQGLLI